MAWNVDSELVQFQLYSLALLLVVSEYLRYSQPVFGGSYLRLASQPSSFGARETILVLLG